MAGGVFKSRAPYGAGSCCQPGRPRGSGEAELNKHSIFVCPWQRDELIRSMYVPIAWGVQPCCKYVHTGVVRVQFSPHPLGSDRVRFGYRIHYLQYSRHAFLIKICTPSLTKHSLQFHARNASNIALLNHNLGNEKATGKRERGEEDLLRLLSPVILSFPSHGLDPSNSRVKNQLVSY